MGGPGSGRKATPPETRFWSYVNMLEDGSECWEWLGSPRSKRDDTGVFWDGYQPVRVTHFTWELAYGKLDPGSRLKHLCGNRRCVNPKHLYLTNPKGDDR